MNGCVIINYKKVREIALLWGVSERTVRDYCSKGIIEGAILIGKTWNIPENSINPNYKKSSLSNLLKEEMNNRVKGRLYHKIQIELTYNTNRIEGSKLTEDETRYIFETNTIGLENKVINIDDIIETTNHFKCIDYIIKNSHVTLTDKFIKKLHFLLKSNTSDERVDWFNVGEYKQLENEVSGVSTSKVEDVKKNMNYLLNSYNNKSNIHVEDIIEFHYEFEKIHPFQDGNGRVGRLIMFKECLKNDIVPFIIKDEMKLFYYRGLKEWINERGYLLDTCLASQDVFKMYLDYFKIKY